ncbi:MAG: GNAT family N-acetyltransferase [Alphaproteobacteria bacterium]
MNTPPQTYHLREHVDPKDRNKVFRLLNSSGGYFLPREMAYGMDLFDEHLTRGDASHYRFLLHEQDETLLGYGCYGPIRFSDRRYHLHWMMIHKEMQGRGLGIMLETAISTKVRGLGGTKIYATVSNRTYQSTKSFYEKCGYKLIANITDLYGDGDDMVYCMKDLILR